MGATDRAEYRGITQAQPGGEFKRVSISFDCNRSASDCLYPYDPSRFIFFLSPVFEKISGTETSFLHERRGTLRPKEHSICNYNYREMDKLLMSLLRRSFSQTRAVKAFVI